MNVAKKLGANVAPKVRIWCKLKHISIIHILYFKNRSIMGFIKYKNYYIIINNIMIMYVYFCLKLFFISSDTYYYRQ